MNESKERVTNLLKKLLFPEDTGRNYENNKNICCHIIPNAAMRDEVKVTQGQRYDSIFRNVEYIEKCLVDIFRTNDWKTDDPSRIKLKKIIKYKEMILGFIYDLMAVMKYKSLYCHRNLRVRSIITADELLDSGWIHAEQMMKTFGVEPIEEFLVKYTRRVEIINELIVGLEKEIGLRESKAEGLKIIELITSE